jgi:hypothetical protein
MNENDNDNNINNTPLTSKEGQLSPLTFQIKLSLKKKSNFILHLVQNSSRQRVYIGSNDIGISHRIKGKTFNNTDEICDALNIKTSNLSKYLYLIDDNGKILDITLDEHFKSSSNNRIVNKASEMSEISTHQLSHPIDESENKVLKVAIIETEKGYNTQTTQDIPEIPEIPETIFIINKLEEPIEENIRKINQYDQNGFEAQQWLSTFGGSDSMSWINQGNTLWNPVASCYALIYYVYKILKWPVEDLRMVVSYNKGAVKFSKVIGDVYKQYNIMDKFNESDILTKVLVWFIASMNSFGVIRPIFFQGSTTNAFKLGPLCSLRQKHEQLLYFITWPMRIDSKYIYILHNQTTIKKYEIQEFLNDLHIYGRGKKILKMIPDWVYKIIVLKQQQ